ncbi:4-amino-4-deoxy-L-arabinose transferase-like glycosyltransferase [Rhodanobacter sp. MP1X3]|nr:4-amino-4-deoxy-L-arabinose transferase-like glycosyltransferase [Rhodanobacter sp. MP1X3]
MDQTVGEANGLVDRVLEWVVVWVLLASGLGLAATLAHHFLAPQVCIATTLLTGIYVWRTRGRRSSNPLAGAKPKHVILLILVCLFFRLPAFNYVLGGQDEGVYVNMANYIERTGSLVVWDTPLDKLQGTPFVQTYLDENRFLPPHPELSKMEAYVGGVYVRSHQSNVLDFQFYHLFPVWMALVAGLFGTTFAVYALTLFALLSVVFMYRLTLVLTGSSRAALIAGLLLAINPLHAFFSKFPVTEVPTLAFSLIGFTYLALFWRAEGGSRHRCWLLVSMLSFGAMFVTHISGFMYVPFLIVVAVASAANDADRVRRNYMQIWVLGVVALYAISVAYGLRWSHQYAADIYRASFERIFPSHWQVGVAALVVVVLLVWFCLVALAQTGMRLRIDRFIVVPLRLAVAPIVLISLALGIYKIYQLGWTAHYQGDVWLDTLWGLAGSHWGAVKASSLVTFFVYTGPLLPLAFLGLVLRRQDEPRIEFLRLFVAGFFVYIVLLQWTVPYGPYYARYLLSEAVPYMLLFSVVAWACMPKNGIRRILSAILAITLIYSVTATASQLGKNENEGAYQSLTQLLAPVDSGDIILLDTLESRAGVPDNNELKTPIVFTFGLSAVTVSGASLADHAYIAALNARYDDVFLISPSAVAPEGFDSMGSTRFRVKAYEWDHSFPHELFMRVDTRLFLYRLNKPIFPLGHPESFKAPGAWNEWLTSGWSDPEAGGVWSSGTHAEITIDPQELSHVVQGIHLNFEVYGLVTKEHPRQRIQVSVNGMAAGTHEVVYPNNQMQFDVVVPAADTTSSNGTRIAFDLPDAVSPQSIGMSSDPRVLGIQLQTMTASPLDSASQLSSPPISGAAAPVVSDIHKLH